MMTPAMTSQSHRFAILKKCFISINFDYKPFNDQYRKLSNEIISADIAYIRKTSSNNIEN